MYRFVLLILVRKCRFVSQRSYVLKHSTKRNVKLLTTSRRKPDARISADFRRDDPTNCLKPIIYTYICTGLLGQSQRTINTLWKTSVMGKITTELAVYVNSVSGTDIRARESFFVFARCFHIK